MNLSFGYTQDSIQNIRFLQLFSVHFIFFCTFRFPLNQPSWSFSLFCFLGTVKSQTLGFGRARQALYHWVIPRVLNSRSLRSVTGWANTQVLNPLVLQSAGITDIYHHILLCSDFLLKKQVSIFTCAILNHSFLCFLYIFHNSKLTHTKINALDGITPHQMAYLLIIAPCFGCSIFSLDQTVFTLQIFREKHSL